VGVRCLFEHPITTGVEGLQPFLQAAATAEGASSDDPVLEFVSRCAAYWQ
jgi:hypothetical protein